MGRFGWVRLAVMALLGAALVVLSPVSSPAQAVDPVTLSGHITGPDGAPLDGARLRVRASGTQAILYATTSDATGAYSVQLAPGTYDLTYLGPPASGLLAKATGKSIPVDSTYDAQVLAGTITLAGSVSSLSAAPRTKVTVFRDNGTVWDGFVDAGQVWSASVLPGNLSVRYQQFDESQDRWFFYATTTQTLQEEDVRMDVVLPMHSVTVRVEDLDGDPVAAQVEPLCSETHPPPWFVVTSFGFIPVSGDTPVLFADTAPTDELCRLTVKPVTGPIQTVTVPHGASALTVVVAPGSHISGTLSDGLGNAAAAGVKLESYDADGLLSGTAVTDAAGHYDLEVVPGNHEVRMASIASSTELSEYFLEAGPVDATNDVPLDLAPEIETLTVHTVTPGGDPAPSSAYLQCSRGAPGPLITRQETTGRPKSGTDLALPGTVSTGGGQCRLFVDPDSGVSSNTIVTLPEGGAELTSVVNPGVTITGQVTVPGITTWTNAEIGVHNFQNDGAWGTVQPDGSFTLSGIAPGDNLLTIQAAGSGYQFALNRRMSIAGGDHLVFDLEAANADVYLLGPTGTPGTATVTFGCSGNLDDSTYNNQSLTWTRTFTDHARFSGLVVPGGGCSVGLTWADGLVDTSRPVTLDPDHDTPVTLVRYGSVLLAGDPTASNDLDDVADAVEAFAPNVGDGDDDGTPDYQQPDVASLPELGGGLGSVEDYVTVEGPAASVLDDVATDDVSAGRSSGVVAGPPDGTVLPRGFVDFTAKGWGAGATKKVVIHVASTAGINGYATYDPATSTWTTLPADRVKINPTSIELTLTDNGIGDVDPVVGRVRHPGGGTKLDVDVPVVVGRALTDPNDKGWYGGNVTVRWSATDDKDNVVAPADTVVTAEGDDVVASSAQVCDRRGNCSSGAVHLKIDKTRPVVNLSGPVDGATYTLGGVPSRQCSGTDPGGSGVPDGGACVVTVTGGSGVGTITVTAKATDRAGNTASKTVSYKVVYKANALSAPAAGSKLKVFKQGSTVVVRLKLLDAKGAAVTPAKAPVWVAPKAKGKSTGKVNQKVSKARPDKGSVLIKRGTYWEYRWGTTKAKAGKAYVITVRLDDGTTRTVTVGIG